ncbi:MAG: hypothetical protein WC709_09325 [Thermoleophilia bacterium]
MTRPTRCRYCGTPIEQAATGRPRQFCRDAHRRLHADVMRSLEPRQRPPLGAPLFHSADAERRLRALHAELRSTARSCYVMANELERVGDRLDGGRFAATADDLVRILAERFPELEEKP